MPLAEDFLATLEELIQHGLHALRETLQQDKELNTFNTSIGICGSGSALEGPVGPGGAFRILEGESLQPFLDSMLPKEAAPGSAPAAAAAPPPPPAPPAASVDQDVEME